MGINFKLLFQPGSTDNYPNHSAMQNISSLEPDFQRMQNPLLNTTSGSHHPFAGIVQNPPLLTPYLQPTTF